MISIDAAQALAELRTIQARLQFPSTVLAVIGARSADRIRLRIEHLKTDPDDDPWIEWAPSTRDSRAHKGNLAQGLLWDEGTLLHSIRVQSDASGVSIGTDLNYAGYLQDGTNRMPARPFIGWDESDVSDAEMTMLHYLEGSLP